MGSSSKTGLMNRRLPRNHLQFGARCSRRCRGRHRIGGAGMLAQPTAWEDFQHRATTREEIDAILNDDGLNRLLSLPRVAIVGPANVGKSTLANQLFGQERWITADVPGTTRDWVGELANIDGLAVMLVDTPGRRETNDPIESAAIAASGAQIGGADLVIAVLDRSTPVDASERRLVESFPDAIRVANKADLPAVWDAAAMAAIAITAHERRSGAPAGSDPQAIWLRSMGLQ